jgi:hypothetical protein
VKRPSSKTYSRPYLSESDELIISALQNIGSEFYKKATAVLNTGESSPDEIHRLVSQSRGYSQKANTYERKLRVIYEATHDH